MFLGDRMRLGVISDLHIYNKTLNIERALSMLNDVDLLLIVGDIADRAEERQYTIAANMLEKHIRSIPVYSVSGNHDNPAKDDASYRAFEMLINREYPSIVDASGAFYKCINDAVDLFGLNPTYHQKQFFFPNKGQQLLFLKERLNQSAAQYHIVLCHPPLIAHNPQRTEDMSPYIVKEQDQRLQEIINTHHNVIFISGHTHIFPELDFDAPHQNLYINNGSICPTTPKDDSAKTVQGNVTLIEINGKYVSATVRGIHTGKIFANNTYFDSIVHNDNFASGIPNLELKLGAHTVPSS